MRPSVSSRLRIGAFAQNTGLVVAGTLIAQVLPLLFYPIFTRLFTPADFGTFAIISMIATPLAIIASGAYEQAFLLVKSERATANLFRFILLRCLAILLLGLLLLLASRDVIALALADPTLRTWLIFVPLISLGQVIYNCTSEWLVRERAFRGLTLNRISQSFTLSLSKLAFGFGGWIGGGLVLGELLGRTLYMGSTYHRVWREPLSCNPANWRRVAAMGRRYRGFPRLMVPDQLINTFGGSIHVLAVGYAFGPTELGYVSLLFSALYLPVTVISSSVKDVFRQRASVDYARTGNCRPLYVKLLWPIALLGVVGFGILYFISPWVFIFVFGDEWAPVGEYARILIPMFFCNFVAMSLGGVLVLAQQMGVSLRWQVTSLMLAGTALVVGMMVFKNVRDTLFLFSAARSLSYIQYIILSYKYAKRSESA
jgi:O-antigen/teichoic acid export membrane protein